MTTPKPLRVFQCSDLHYCPKHLPYVDAAFATAWDQFKSDGLGPWVIAGDSFDSTMGIHQPAFSAFLGRTVGMAQDAPGVVLQGTFSHDYPGSLEPLKRIDTKHPILVAETPGVWALCWDSGAFHWREVDSLQMAEDGYLPGCKLVVTVLPSLNKALPEIREIGAGAWVQSMAVRFGPINRVFRKKGVPTVLITHGTIVGCYTESKYAMISPDHEFTTELLASFSTDACMIGHIHKYQSFEESGCEIVYAGSLAPLVFGRDDPAGYVSWLFEGSTRSKHTFRPVDSVEKLELEYDGPPDMQEIEEVVEAYPDVDEADFLLTVKVRWTIDEEHATRVDRRRIRSLLERVAHVVKLDQRINRIQSVRAAGIGEAMTTEEKLAIYLHTTGDEGKLDDLSERLELVQSMPATDVLEIIAQERPTI